MLLVGQNIVRILPILRFELFNQESSFLIQTNLLIRTLAVLKNHFKYQFKMLTCISGVDYPEKLHRFLVVYELLSLRYNARIRIKILADEFVPIDSAEAIYSAASWWESEVWDMFGVFFLDQKNLTRLLTDYGFQGYPLRKDFPLSGFIEMRYHESEKRVLNESIELSQEYRTFNFSSPWHLEKYYE